MTLTYMQLFAILQVALDNDKKKIYPIHLEIQKL